MKVGAKLHNYVINADQLNFLKTDDDDFEGIEVEPLLDGPTGNRGYLPTVYVDEEEGESFVRRNYLVEELKAREMQRMN